MFGHPDFDDHEQLVFVCDAAAGLRAIIALHSTALGPAFGGCRMWPYASEADALKDALRLARGMSCKAAICDLPYGGGKSVILGDPEARQDAGPLARDGPRGRAAGRPLHRGGRHRDDPRGPRRDARGDQPHRGRDGGGAGAARGHRLWRADGAAGRRPAPDRPGRPRRPAGRDPGPGQCRPAACGPSARRGGRADRGRSGSGARGQGGRGARGAGGRSGGDLRPAGRSAGALCDGCGAQRRDPPAPAGEDRVRRRQQPAGAPPPRGRCSPPAASSTSPTTSPMPAA